MLYERMRKLGFKDNEIECIVKDCLLSRIPLKTIEKKIDDIIDIFLKFGFSNKQLIKISVKYPTTYKHSIEYLLDKFNSMLKLGYKKEEVIKIITYFPNNIGIDLDKKIASIEELGYTFKEVIKMLKFYPILSSFSIENMKNKMDFMLDLGFEKTSVLRITKKFPQIYSYDTDSINKKIDYLIKIGFEKKEIINMINLFPQLLSLNINKIKNMVEELIGMGYTREDVLKIAKLYPPIFGSSVDNIKEKKEFYDSIGLSRIILIDPKLMMQSVDLSYARYMYFKSIGIDIDMNNYVILFRESKRFKSKYGKSNEELLDEFKFDRTNKKRKKL